MKKIIDEFTDLPISRQEKWMLRKKKQGLCVICGKPTIGTERCKKHAVWVREYMRKKLNCRKRNKLARSYAE